MYLLKQALVPGEARYPSTAGLVGRRTNSQWQEVLDKRSSLLAAGQSSASPRQSGQLTGGGLGTVR